MEMPSNQHNRWKGKARKTFLVLKEGGSKHSAQSEGSSPEQGKQQSKQTL